MAERGARSSSVPSVAFFQLLWQRYSSQRERWRAGYPERVQRFLDYNDPDKRPAAFLRRPQFEALEVYVFLKEGLHNAPLPVIFEAWQQRRPPFEDRPAGVPEGFDMPAAARAFGRLEQGRDATPTTIFALTMGTGKTLLMATTIFLDFLMAAVHPSDPRYAHNALVFAPDTTVLQSLREIQTFDRRKVVPPELVALLDAHLRIHVLCEPGTALHVLEGSRFNLILSNTQKIILRRRSRPLSPVECLLRSGRGDGHPGTERLEEGELVANQRFETLRRLARLAIYVDEAHHAFGRTLAQDLGRTGRATTRLRRTIEALAEAGREAGRPLVACHNFTGTPYAKGRLFEEVVYAYGLRAAIDAAYLKRVRVRAYANTRADDFVQDVLTDFFAQHPGEVRYGGLRPKLAIFATTIAELRDELRPRVEAALRACGRPLSTLLLNVGDPRLTTRDDLREFGRLDQPESDKQVILLVNKGKEGWNCRSLFGVALYRRPKSRIFVLQASMRCLRSIDPPPQRTGTLYLSEENVGILEAELQQNFRIDLREVEAAGGPGGRRKGRPSARAETVAPAPTAPSWQVVERAPAAGLRLGLSELELDGRGPTVVELQGLPGDGAPRRMSVAEVGGGRRRFSALTLTAELARSLNQSPLRLERILRESEEGMEAVLQAVNAHEEVLYDHLLPTLFHALYDLRPTAEAPTHARSSGGP